MTDPLDIIKDKLKKLDAEKDKLLKDAKQEALDTAKEAIATLNELGFNYQLVEGSKPVQSTGTRRSGIRQEVLQTVKQSQAGMTRADLIEHFKASDDIKLQQSISNALSNLKKAGQLNLTDGTYTAP